MDIIRNLMIEFLESLNLSQTLANLLADITLFVGLVIIAVIGYLVVKVIYNVTLKKMGLKSQNKFVKGIFKSSVILNLIKLIPVIFLIQMGQFVPTITTFVNIAFTIVLAYYFLKITMSTIDLVNELYMQYDTNAKKKPIKGVLSFIKIIIVIIVIIVVVSNLLGESPAVILAGLGAMSAVLMLIFQDSILGLVAGFQMSANDLVRIGDWIEMPKYGVDGHVKDVTLTFIQVENWDKTTITIPAYKLISDAFINWRSVFETGGRRIKRSFNIDVKSVSIVDDALYEKLMKVDFLKTYLTTKKLEIDKFNQERQIDASILLNGRRLTNLGVFRIYLTEYLKNHPDINPSMWRIVRQLQTTNTGVPIEVYAFSSKTSWADYETVMADIFDHIYATTSYFGLRIFQEPTGTDFINLNK